MTLLNGCKSSVLNNNMQLKPFCFCIKTSKNFEYSHQFLCSFLIASIYLYYWKWKTQTKMFWSQNVRNKGTHKFNNKSLCEKNGCTHGFWSIKQWQLLGLANFGRGLELGSSKLHSQPCFCFPFFHIHENLNLRFSSSSVSVIST